VARRGALADFWPAGRQDSDIVLPAADTADAADAADAAGATDEAAAVMAFSAVLACHPA
jgi:hypothetical protein